MREPIKRLFGSVTYGVSIHVDSNEFSKDMVSVISFYQRNHLIKTEGCKSVYDLGQKLRKFWMTIAADPSLEVNDRKLAGWLEDYFSLINLQKANFRSILEAIKVPYMPIEEGLPKILPSFRIEQKAEGMEESEFFSALELIESLETEKDLEVAIEEEAAERRSIYEEIIALLRENDGKIRYTLLKRLMDDVEEEELKRAIHELKTSGEIFESEPGRIRLLQQVLIEEEGFYLGPLARK